MKPILLALFLCLLQLAKAQPTFTNAKAKNHSISFYVGANAFQEYRSRSNQPGNSYIWQSINPYIIPSFTSLSNLFSLTYKYKKHEIIPLMYLGSYYNNNKAKPFVLGGSLSYLYHFNQKPTHLFFEANLQTLFYTKGSDGKDIVPYGNNQFVNGWAKENFYSTSIQTYMLNPALGLEVKLFKLTYLQLAVGSGAYYLKGKSITPIAESSQFGYSDPYRNTYSGQFGFNWYARLSIIVRAFNF
ncbi:MAG TPA: hypothetical protein VK835_08320 [Bacteroidia bacterium]|jgi:hypothetical protein|nr:hypothetical protein [Bacteroidia bacterium]